MYDRQIYRKELNPLSGDAYSQRQAELIAQFGESENVNEHGVYRDYDTICLPTKRATAELRVVQGSDQLWRCDYLMSTPTSGRSASPSFLDKGYATRESALSHTAQRIIERDKHYLSSADFKVVADYAEGLVEQAGEQLSLF